MDFVHDQLATGRKLRVLTIVETATDLRIGQLKADSLANDSR